MRLSSRAAVLKRMWRWSLGLSLALAGVGLMTILFGIPDLTPAGLWGVLNGGGTELERLGVYHLRSPRLVLACLSGAALGLAGAIMQDGLRNPLAGPELLGISAGAAAAAAVVIVFNPSLPGYLVPWLTLAGGLLSAGIVLAVMARMGKPSSSAVLVLVGAALSAAFAGALTLVMVLGGQQEYAAIGRFMSGGLAGLGWPPVGRVLPWFALGIPAALMLGRVLNLLQAGDDIAESKGVRVVRVRLFILALGSALTAAVVSVAGAISFVALAAPHVARRLLGTNDSRLVLPVAALVGALQLTAADLAARLVFSPIEVSVGFWTALSGGPVLLLVLHRHLRAATE
ncbi:MAG: FecCD family ABC transporter permease [Acidimicrobiales bacterium]